MAFCRNSNDLKNWEARKDIIMDVLIDFDFDICGAQEPYAFQLEYLAGRAAGYALSAEPLGDENPEKFAERAPNFQDRHLILPNMNNPVWYKRDKFDVLESGRFWFSSTPSKESGGWDEDRWDGVRHCHWVKFKAKESGKTFYVFNVHLIVQNRNIDDKHGVKSVELLLLKAAEISQGMPFFVTGDFNAKEKSDRIKLMDASPILTDSKKIAQKAELGRNATYVGFDGKANGGIIDYIYVSKGILVERFEIIERPIGGIYPSDHLPIFIDATIP